MSVATLLTFLHARSVVPCRSDPPHACPSYLEEIAMSGSMCIAVNQHGELCGIHKPGGMAVDAGFVEICLGIAVTRAKELTNQIQVELDRDLEQRRAAQRNVHQRYRQSEIVSVDWAVPAMQEAAPPPPAPAVKVTPRARNQDQHGTRWRTGTATARATAVVPSAPPATAESLEVAAATARAAAVASAGNNNNNNNNGEIANAFGVGALFVQDDDFAAELEAVEAEARELEEQLAAATAAEEVAVPVNTGRGTAAGRSAAPATAAATAAGASVVVSIASDGEDGDDLGATVMRQKRAGGRKKRRK
eukprot:NODE_5424_length_1772_cov_6.001824.p1 GENE.NODE_5424_length_1772_cov_6.001824~~NODE_5424_length_1772_cov_6.001824.p1  ORF type:complete len:305 (-),score=70.25 NODE_5424_length_1772_cov_6.001824:310-1224(-)